MEGVCLRGFVQKGFMSRGSYVWRGVLSEFFLSVQHIKQIEMAILVVIYLM